MKRLRKLLARQRALIEGATAAGREMTDAERAEFNSIQDQIRAI